MFYLNYLHSFHNFLVKQLLFLMYNFLNQHHLHNMLAMETYNDHLSLLELMNNYLDTIRLLRHY